LHLRCDFSFEQTPDFPFIHTLRPELVHNLSHQLLRVPHLFGPGTASAAGGDERAQPMPDLEQAFLF
jgi:hypothetical protein